MEDKIKLLGNDTTARISKKLGLINGDLIPNEYGVKVLSVSNGWLYTEALHPISENLINIHYGINEGDKIQLRPVNKDGLKELKNWCYGKKFPIGTKDFYIQNSYITRYKDKYIIDVYLMNEDGLCMSAILLDSDFFTYI